MRLGKYQVSEKSGSANTAITFLLIGLGAGALTALLLAPKGGKQIRKDLRRKYESARETFDDWTEDARDTAESVYERGSEIADDLRDRVKPLAKAMRRG
jgi:gas vesicle protein